MLGGGKYNAIATTARHNAQASGVILWVVDGYDGHGFEAQLPPEELPYMVKALREVADKLEKDIAHQSLLPAVAPAKGNQ